jgi:hypothetical protein
MITATQESLSKKEKRKLYLRIFQIVVFSRALNRRSENVIVKAVIIAKLKFSDIEREIFCADLMERADYTALEYAPEALNRTILVADIGDLDPSLRGA